MSKITCHNCFGEKYIFNGRDWILCKICKGDGVVEDFDQEDYYPDRYFPDDRVPFDDDLYYPDE
jgi:hypothetical protein